MFNSTYRSCVPVVVSENQTPAHPFTLENFPHKFWVMVKSCKEELLNWASLDGKKSKKHPWLVRVKTCSLVWACWHKEKPFVENTSLGYRVHYQNIPTAFQLLCGKCLHVGVFYCDNCNTAFSVWFCACAVARVPQVTVLAGHGAMPLFVLGWFVPASVSPYIKNIASLGACSLRSLVHIHGQLCPSRNIFCGSWVMHSVSAIFCSIWSSGANLFLISTPTLPQGSSVPRVASFLFVICLLWCVNNIFWVLTIWWLFVKCNAGFISAAVLGVVCDLPCFMFFCWCSPRVWEVPLFLSSGHNMPSDINFALLNLAVFI